MIEDTPFAELAKKMDEYQEQFYPYSEAISLKRELSVKMLMKLENRHGEYK